MSETLGQRLKKEREARFLTLEKAADETRIRQVFLQALEADDYSVMPSAAQGRGFMRNYAEYLNLNIDEMIAEIQKNPPVFEEVSGPLPQVNLVETELPPLTQEDENPAPRFLTSWLTRKPKSDASLEVDELSDENQLMEQDQLEIHEEAKKSWLEKIKSRFGFGIKEEEPEANQEIEQEEIVLEENIPSQPADLIFVEIGKQLRERRELISLTIDEVERHTHLRSVFVKALEDGSFEKLPSPVQTRGMLLNYANFLDLDADKILLRFADALQARRREKYAETPREKIQTQVNASIPWLRTFVAGDLIFGVTMIAVLVALAIWGVGNLVNTEDEIEPTVISFVEAFDVETPTPTLQSTFVAVDDPSLVTAVDENSSEAPTPDINANVVVNLFALERVFIRVSVDGELVFEGRMAPRESKVFQAENQVVILTGDGSALRITYNGQDLGLMGGAGEVVNRVYLISGVATPTATVPPTATPAGALALRDLIENLGGGAPPWLERFVVRDRQRFRLVPVREAVRIEAAGNYAEIHAQGRTFLIRDTMASLEQRLDPARFARIHRSTIVSIEHVTEIEPDGGGDFVVTLDDGVQVRMTRAYRERLLPRNS